MTLDIKTIAPAELYAEMERLKQAEGMDFLVSLTGMDWGEEGGLGVIYQLESTKTGNRINLKTATTDRENPYLPSVSDLWAVANIYEREAYDFSASALWVTPTCAACFCVKTGWAIPSARTTTRWARTPCA